MIQNFPPSKGLTQKQPPEKMSSSDAYLSAGFFFLYTIDNLEIYGKNGYLNSYQHLP